MKLSPAADADGNTFAVFNMHSYPAPEPGFIYAALGLPSAGSAVLSYPLPPDWSSPAARSAARSAALPRNESVIDVEVVHGDEAPRQSATSGKFRQMITTRPAGGR